MPGREDGKFVAIGDWNGDFRNTDFKQVNTDANKEVVLCNGQWYIHEINL